MTRAPLSVCVGVCVSLSLAELEDEVQGAAGGGGRPLGKLTGGSCPDPNDTTSDDRHALVLLRTRLRLCSSVFTAFHPIRPTAKRPIGREVVCISVLNGSGPTRSGRQYMHSTRSRRASYTPYSRTQVEPQPIEWPPAQHFSSNVMLTRFFAHTNWFASPASRETNSLADRRWLSLRVNGPHVSFRLHCVGLNS